MNLTADEKKELQRLVDDEKNNMTNINNELDQIKKDKDKKQERLYALQDEILNQQQKLADYEKDIKMKDDEIEDLRVSVDDLQKQNEFLNQEKAKWGDDMVGKIEFL